MTAPQTYEPSRVGGARLPLHGFLPGDYQDANLGAVHPPCIRVQIENTSGDINVSICSRTWDSRRLTVLQEQCGLTDSQGHRYRLAPFKPNAYANREIGASRWIQYSTYAFDPSSGKRHNFYGNPHTLRVAYTENGRYYVAERQFAATYPLITPFNFLPLTNP